MAAERGEAQGANEERERMGTSSGRLILPLQLSRASQHAHRWAAAPERAAATSCSDLRRRKTTEEGEKMGLGQGKRQITLFPFVFHFCFC